MAAKSPCRTRCAAFQKPMKSPPKREPSDSSWKYLIRLPPACVARHIAHNSSNVFCNGRMCQRLAALPFCGLKEVNGKLDDNPVQSGICCKCQIVKPDIPESSRLMPAQGEIGSRTEIPARRASGVRHDCFRRAQLRSQAMAQPIETTLDQRLYEVIAQRQRDGGSQHEQRDEAQREQRRDRRHHGEMHQVDGVGMPP